jgi:hypothetical protein
MVGLKKHKNFKKRSITQYLILEGLDSVGKATLLDDMEISNMAQPPNVVWL